MCAYRLVLFVLTALLTSATESLKPPTIEIQYVLYCIPPDEQCHYVKLGSSEKGVILSVSEESSHNRYC